MTFFEAYQEMKNGKEVCRTSVHKHQVFMCLTGWPGEPKHIKTRTSLPSWPDIIIDEDIEATDWRIVDEEV